jgi:RHH-type rel operon transcriptional repressor/antitoxin RelB
LIENGIGAIEEIWLPPAVLAQVREGVLPSVEPTQSATADLFSD